MAKRFEEANGKYCSDVQEIKWIRMKYKIIKMP